MQLSAGRFGKISRAYIRTTQDRAVTPKLQSLMLERTPCDIVLSIDSSHTPFLSRPADLAELISYATARKQERAKGA